MITALENDAENFDKDNEKIKLLQNEVLELKDQNRKVTKNYYYSFINKKKISLKKTKDSNVKMMNILIPLTRYNYHKLKYYKMKLYLATRFLRIKIRFCLL